MAGLGTALNPNGESGTVDTPVINQTDVKQNSKQDIVQTTSIETVQHILYRDWIYSRTYNIDSSMKPGHVFGFIRIHPGDCNKYVSYIANMFKTWTGGMKVRARFMANFANGGSFRIGYLPPIFRKSEILNIPLATLTAYPNQDLDPKNTDWTEFRTSDQRNIAYHYMQNPDEIEDVQNFGGWIVFYVVGSLVQSLQTTGAVQMVIETAGDFEFRQLAPLTSGFVEGGPFPTNILGGLSCQGGCDNRYVNRITTMHALPPAMGTTIKMGGVLARKLNGEYVQATQLSQYASDLRSRWTTSLQCKTDDDYAFTAVTSYNHGRFATGTSWPAPSRSEFCVAAATKSIGGETGKNARYRFSDWVVQGSYGNFDAVLVDGETEKFEAMASGRGFVCRPVKSGYDTVTATAWHGASDFPNTFPEESLVVFFNQPMCTVDLQTFAMAEHLRRYKPGGVGFLYSLRSANTTGPIMWLRLSQEGMFTTNAVANRVDIADSSIYLQYEQELSPSAPLPPVPSPLYLMENMRMVRKAHKQGLTLAQLNEQ